MLILLSVKSFNLQMSRLIFLMELMLVKLTYRVYETIIESYQREAKLFIYKIGSM